MRCTNIEHKKVRPYLTCGNNTKDGFGHTGSLDRRTKDNMEKYKIFFRAINTFETVTF